MIDLTGRTYGRLSVLWHSHTDEQAMWFCECVCGTRVVAPGYKLRSGRKRSCGCLERENSMEFVKRGTKHGRKHHPLYYTYRSMLARCYRPTHVSYGRYGGRGIRVYPEWGRFEAFYEWAIENGWKKGLTIDRIDNDGNYEPDNCRFADAHVQANNRSSNVCITWRGRTMTLAEWSRELGIKRRTLEARIVSGWPYDRAFTEPVQR